MARKLILSCALLLACLQAGAQFYTYGTDPASAKWHTIETDTYRLVYPAEMDSLAREYAYRLELYKQPIASTVGYLPNESFRKKHPVVLHPYTAYSNGMVMWAPRRTELLTVPDAYDPDPTTWVNQLAVHESRHVAQMQFIRGNVPFKMLGWLTGDIEGGWAAIYPGLSFLEGDAVVAETALSHTGRGRTADFMEYFRVAFGDGDYRNYWKWRWNSQKNYTPDYYRVGYMLHAGMRNLYDCPDFTIMYYDNALKGGMFALQRTVKQVSGKSFKETFKDIQGYFQSEWTSGEKARGPFIEGTQVTATPRRYEEINSLTFVGDSTLYAIRHGIARNKELVEIDSLGKVQHKKYFSSSTSRLAYSKVSGRVYWTELTPSTRWSLKNYSTIKYYVNNSVFTLDNSRQHRYFNPAPSPSELKLAVVEYMPNGECYVVVLSELDGTEVKRFRAPSGVQPVEPVWVGDELFVSAIDEDGYSIRDLISWVPLFSGKCKVNRLFEKDGRIWFTSDMNGVNELYSLDFASGNVWQESSTRYGAKEFAFVKDTLYYSVPTDKGRVVFKAPESELVGTAADLEGEAYPSAEQLYAQETMQIEDVEREPQIGEPSRYSKFGHLFKLHSWAPIYFNYDFASTLKYDDFELPAALGAMLFFQNDLGTSYGTAGVSFWPEGDYNLNVGGYAVRPGFAGHLQYVYAGWLPKIELRADLGERSVVDHKFSYDSEEKSYILNPQTTGSPLLNLSATVYVPINLSSGGWYRGLIPEVQVSYNNDKYDRLAYMNNKIATGHADGGLFTNFRLSFYNYLPVPSSCIFPRLGIGGEIGTTVLPLMYETYPNTAYASAYAYLPGLMRTHGLKVKGYYNTNYGGDFYNTDRWGASLDYALPFAPVDWTFLCPAFYIRNFELIGHATYDNTVTHYRVADDDSYTYLHAGASLRVHLANFLWFPFDTILGVKYLHNFSDAEYVSGSRESFSFVFSVDI